MKNMISSAHIKLALLLALILTSNELSAQLSPAPNDTLNFTSVLFEFPWIDGAQSYELIAIHESGPGNLSATSEANKIRLDGLSFGSNYSWKVRGLTAIGEKMPWSTPVSFHIATSDYIDTSKYRYTGRKLDRSKSQRNLLFLDYGHVGINKAGKADWFIPETDSLFTETLVRDLKITPSGTFTAIFGESAVEFDRKGTILWMAPDNGKVNGEEREHYHHEFTKLPNGNYLVLGQDHVMRKVPESNDSIKVEFGTVIEYSPNGTVVWSWNSNDYFTDDDLFSRGKRYDQYQVRTHMNACTARENEVYVGFRDISRIIVIDKKSGKVTESYGGYGVFSEPHAGTGFFRRQHDALRLSDGNMAVLNNDSIMDPDVVSSVVVFSRLKDGTSDKLLDFKLNFDSLTNGKSAKTGNINELSSGNLLVNLGSINRFIELTRSGELVWSMFSEKLDPNTKKWRPFPQYRVCPAPSLYPYVYTAKLIRNSLKKRKRVIDVKVFNIGSEADSFRVTLYKKGRKVQSQTLSIHSETQGLITFHTKRKSAYSVEIRSAKTGETQRVEIPDFK